MANKTATIAVRIEPEVKKEVEKIFNAIGLSTAEAINVFFRHVQLAKGIPFMVEIPNKETRKTIAEARRGKGKKFNSAKEMFDELQI